MKDIFEILRENGIEVEEGKQKDIRRSLNENYIAVNEHTKKINALTEQVNTANNTVTDLKGKLDEAEKVDVKALQDRIKHFEDDEKARKDAESKAAALQALKDRFTPLRGEKKFLNEGTEQWMFSEFEKALALEENKSKSDAEIYEAITKDKNIYENPNQKFTNPPVGGQSARGDNDRTATLMKAMGIKEKE